MRASTQQLLALGFRGRTAIHPAQLSVINEVFTPTSDEVQKAQRLVAAFEQAGQTIEVGVLRKLVRQHAAEVHLVDGAGGDAFADFLKKETVRITDVLKSVGLVKS